METMKPEEPVDAKRHKRKNQSAEATMELIHIKEKKKKGRDHSVAMATDIVGEDSAVPVETHHKKKKKKKKKRELENVTSETDINGEESEVAMETEHKRKKKKKEEEKVTSETYNRGEDSDVALETEHKKKKKKEEEENVTIATYNRGEESEVALETEHRKKKKKKKKEEEEENVTIETDINAEESEVALETEHKKKKRKKREQEHVTVATDINAEESEVALETEHKKKKRKKREQEHVTIATENNGEDSEVSVETEHKKKEGEENVTIETYNRGEESEVALETEHKKKKKKKTEEEEEENVTIETYNRGEDSEVALETEHKKKKKKKGKEREQGHVTIATDINGEESEVSMETEHKKKRDDETVSIKTYNRGEDSEVTMETEHKKKKKKKKKQDVTSGTDNIGESEVAVQTEPQEEENVTIATSISDEVSVKREQRHWSCESVSMATASSCRTRSKKPAEEKNDWVDPALLQELEEFVPNVRTRSADAIRKLLRYDLERFRRFKQQGVAVRWGRGSEEEDQMIVRNLQDFMALTGISSPTELVYPERYLDKCQQIKTLKAQHGFLEKIAEGIPRPCLQVYLKARRMFDPLNHRGRFSEDEIKSLIKLQTQYGNDWKLISEKMGRSIFSLQKRFNNLAAGRGPWTPEETHRLKKAVRTHLEGLQSPSGLTRPQLSSGLPWNRICQEVQTRSWVQCRVKWLSLLQNRLALHTDMFGRGGECVRTKILLLKVLFEKCPTSTADVRWDEVAQAMGKMTRLSAQKMFQRLKYSRVPGWRKMSNKEIIQTLHREVLPLLEARLEDLKDGLQNPENPGNRPEENRPKENPPEENPPEENYPPEETYPLDLLFAEDQSGPAAS